MVKKLIAGPRSYICDECVNICLDIIAGEREELHEKPDMPGKGANTDWSCSFCNKQHTTVKKLIAGPGGVSICDECLDICLDIVSEERTDQESCFLCHKVLSGKQATAVTVRIPLSNGVREVAHGLGSKKIQEERVVQFCGSCASQLRDALR